MKPFLFLISSLICAIISVLFLEGTWNTIFFFTMFTLVNNLFTIWLRNKKVGFNDALVFFTLFFLAYNVLFFLQVLGDIKDNQIQLSFFPIQFKIEIYATATMTSFLASIGLLLSSFWPLKSKYHKLDEINSNFLITGFVGVLFFSIGVTLMFLDFQRAGGFFYLLSLPRVNRLEILSSLSGSLPYAPFVFVGLSLIWISYSKKGLHLFWAVGTILFWIILMIVQGDRRFLLYSLMIVTVSYFSIRFDRLMINKKIGISLILLYLIFSFFAQIRWLIQQIITKEMNPQLALNWIINNFSLNWFLPGYNEFIGPNFTLLHTLSQERNLSFPLFGVSYLNAFGNLLPRSLYPGEKPMGLSFDFSTMIHDQYMSDVSGVIGWGYSPIAEAVQNFSYIGIVPLFFLLGVILKWITNLRFSGWQGILFYALIIPQTFNLNRTDFIWVFQEAVYYIIVGLLSIVTVSFLNGLAKKNILDIQNLEFKK